MCFSGFIFQAKSRRKICYEIFSVYCTSQLGSANNTFTIKVRPTHAASQRRYTITSVITGERGAFLWGNSNTHAHYSSSPRSSVTQCNSQTLSPVLMFPSSRSGTDIQFHDSFCTCFASAHVAGERSRGRQKHKPARFKA